MNRYKIFIVTLTYPDEYGGTGANFIHNQCVSLKKAGVDVSVLFYDFRSIRKKRKLGLSMYLIDSIPVYRLAIPCGPIKPLLFFLRKFFCNMLYKFALQFEGEPSFFHAHFYIAGDIAYNLFIKHKISYFVTEHSSCFLDGGMVKKDIKMIKRIYDKP